MHSFTGLLVFLLATRSISADPIDVAELVDDTDRCISSHSGDCPSPKSTQSANLPRTPPPQSTFLPASDDTFEPQTILNPPGTTFTPPPPSHSPRLSTTPTSTLPWALPSQSTPRTAADDSFEPQTILNPLDSTLASLSPTQSSILTLNPTSTTPPSSSLHGQNPLPNPNTPYPDIIDLSLTLFDRGQCLKNKHCLLCRDANTTLACYKYNCQCQRGIPVTHYMPASQESCYREELCLSCPAGSMPFSWGRMAVCLTVWKHRPQKGEGNPLTNWTGDGVKSLPVGKVVMNGGTSSRLRRGRPGFVIMVGSGVVAGLYLGMV